MIPWPHSGVSSRRSRKFKRTDRRSLRSIFEALERRALLAAGDVLANHYTAGSTGEDLNETVLTPANVNQSSFGKVFTTTLDGQVYAQILAVANVNSTRGASTGLHNVLFAATMHDSLYAIDATTGAILWQDSFLNISNPAGATAAPPTATTGVTTFPAVSGDNSLVNGSDIGPELGILATPTIDPNTGILYLVADTQEFRNGSTPASTFTSGTTDIHYVQRLWAVNIANGSVAITPSNPAVEPSSGGMVFADTILNPTGTNTVPSFSSYTGYKYVAGPYIKGTGNNSDTFNANGTVNTTNNADGWAVNTADTTSIFAGTTPSASGYVAFNGLLQMNRVATTLINGVVYLGFASHGDDGPYYGWLLGYNASTLANVSAFVTVPTFDGLKGSAGFTSVGGLWASGGSITTDGTYLYFTVGNGSFNPAVTNFNANYFAVDGTNHALLPLDGDYGDTVLKVAVDANATQTNVNLANNASGNPTPTGAYNPDGGYNATGYGLKVVDYFAPSNLYELNLADEDIGSGGVLLIPSTGPDARTAHFNSATGTYTVQADSTGDPMLVTAGKEGRIYLIDANNMGGFNTQYITDGNQLTANDPAPYDRIIGEFYYYETTSGHSGTKANNQTYKGYDIPSYFNGEIYVGLGGGSGSNTTYVGQLGFNLANFPFTTATPRTGVEPTPNFVSSNLFGGRGTTATISANGLTNGIIWNNDITQTSTDYLAAYSVSSSGTVTPIYTSNLNSARDSLTGGVSGATGVKFSIPTVFDGMVYDGTGGGSGTGGHILGTVVGYGLITTTPPSLGIFTNNQDVGSPSPAGTSSFNTTTGVYTVAGGGNDISGTSDQFQFLYKTLTGDGSITAEVTSMTNTNSSAKAGIMFRDSTAANGIDPFLAISASGQPIKLEGRNTDGGTATIDDSTAANLTAPYWIRLIRVGSLFTAYTSPDGTTWTLLGSITVSMGSTALVGLAVSSHSVGALNTSTFQNVSVLQFTAAANASPPIVTGTSTNLNAVASENGSGTGITYTWSATNKPGGSNPQFSVNGTNAAQNTTVTFNQAGSYSFLVTATDAAGVSITSSVNVTVNQTLTSISVSPPTASLTSGQTQAFSATALDQFGNALSVQPSFTWTVDNGSVGNVNSSTGMYTAPLSPAGPATVRATSGAVSGTAAVTVSYLKGDLNLDGHRDMSDVRTLMQALTDLGGYQFNHQLSNQDLLTLADIDGDNQITNQDLQALLNLLLAGSGSTSSDSFSSSPPVATAPSSANVPDTDSSPVVDSSSTDNVVSAPAVINLPTAIAATPPVTIASPDTSDNVSFPTASTNSITVVPVDATAPAAVHTQIEIDVAASHSSALPSGPMVSDQSNSASTFASSSSIQKSSQLVDQVLTAWTARRARRMNFATTTSDAADPETLDELFAAFNFRHSG